MKSVLSSISITTALLLAGCGSSSSSTASDAPTSEAQTQTQTVKASVKTPLQDLTGIPVDPLFNVVFNTVMDPASINGETVYLVAENTDTAVAGTVTLLEDKVTAVFKTTEALLPGAVYNLVVTTGVKDLFGNHILSNVTSTFNVSSVARIAVPLAMPVVGTVLSNDATQLLLSSLSGMMGLTELLPVQPDELLALAAADLTINDLLCAIQEQNPAASTVGELLGTQLSLEALLGILSDKLPVGSSAVAPVEAIIAKLAAAPGDLLGQTLSLGDILTLPAELLPLDPTSLSAQDVLSVATNPLALLETIAQVLNAGGLVNAPVVGPIIANVTSVGGLVLDGGVLTQIPGAAQLTSLISLDQLQLVNTILGSANPLALIEAILGGGDLTGLLSGDQLATVTGLLAVLAPEEVTGLLGGLTSGNVTGLLGGLTGGDLTSLISLEQLQLVNVILGSVDPLALIEAILGGGDLTGLLSGDQLATVTGLLAVLTPQEVTGLLGGVTSGEVTGLLGGELLTPVTGLVGGLLGTLL